MNIQSNKSLGEEEYASAFIFNDSVNEQDKSTLQDYLYKFSFNLSEAYEYLFLVLQMHDLEASGKSELFDRVYAMGLQCLALCFRKITDNSSERSVRKLIKLAVEPKSAKEHLDEIENIYSHYEKFLNKFVVHQDTHSIHEGISFFPEAETVISDLEFLREYYLTLVHKLCNGYININGEGGFYTFELEKLL